VPIKVRINATGKVVDIYPVEDMTSLPGESKISFLHRVRHVMVRYSDKQTHETCGDICSDGTAYAIRITTTRATMQCVIPPVCPVGFSTTNESIHSHCPARRNLKATIADEIVTAGKIRKGQSIAMCDTERFSSLDFSGRRPGWLAGVRALHQHDGPARVTRHEPDDEDEKRPTQEVFSAD
jgi:hypothetical protein